MAHRGEQKGDLLLVVADIGRLGHHLDDENDGGGLVHRAQAGEIMAELIAEHGNEDGHTRRSGGGEARGQRAAVSREQAGVDWRTRQDSNL